MGDIVNSERTDEEILAMQCMRNALNRKAVGIAPLDEVNNPSHYKLFPDMEAFDVIKATLTPEELRGYLKGNILKYRLRAGQKGPVEKCVAKADWYKARLFEQEQA